VQQNAALGQRLRQFYGPDGKHAPPQPVKVSSVAAWLDRLGLAEQAKKFPGQLSGGQRQRTAIARTLVLQPDLLLMDEPFSSLDAPTRENLQNLILELKNEQGLTLITVTHAIEEAAVLGEKILVLGQPPNRYPVVIDNPQARMPAFRSSSEYAQLCQSLRTQLTSEVG
jgi:NitT/TauT family transport system ATP-binding protein